MKREEVRTPLCSVHRCILIFGRGVVFMSTASQIRATPTALAVPNTTHALVPQSTFALLRRTHPYIASSLSLGLVIGGTVVLLPAIALGIEAWNRMKEGANKAGGQIVCPA